MERLDLKTMFKALKVEKNKEMMYKILHKIDPEIRMELIKYMIEN